jgi:preprotein translocase subunit SecG
MSVLIVLFTFGLIVVSLLLILVVLMQKAKSDGGVAAMGGGVAESTFGAETGNVLITATKNLTIAFFALSFGLYLANVYQAKHRNSGDDKLPTVVAPVNAAQPATLPPSAPKKP